MFLRIHPDNPEDRKIQQVLDCLRNGGLIIYPTDTVYGIGCDIFNSKAI
jgi:tRNA A37 threonylcarbamoyladenosine synthetase subunit TsaC/SUA5/YrdC